ncbi:MAG: hypothetical protein MJE77_32270 [Proteobacteria bacterium]|nr:hypothetical protein [Pseudomonadota bacterium]
MALRFDEQTRAHYRAGILRKGKQIAEALADVLAGKERRIQLRELPASGQKPGMRLEERLRAYLDHVEACRALLDASDDRFGRCRRCGVDLGELALAEMPWADRCPDCAAELG